MLAGVFRLSRDHVRQVVVEVFGIPTSKGSIDNAIMRMSVIMADPWAELREAIRRAQAVHVDETTWRLQGAQQWLWFAASALVACFRIDPARSQAAAKELLGEEFGGFVISDRHTGYHFLDVLQQQLCWCHVIRQLVEVSQLTGAAGRRGTQLVKLARQVIAVHREFLQDRHDADWLSDQLAPLRHQIRLLLEQCAAGRHTKTANFAAGLLEEYDALWTFCDVPNLAIEPTNNAAERAVHHAVLQRRFQGATQSDHGSRWIKRIQSVRESGRQQAHQTAPTRRHNASPVDGARDDCWWAEAAQVERDRDRRRSRPCVGTGLDTAGRSVPFSFSSRWSGAQRIVRRLGWARPGMGIAHIWRALRLANRLRLLHPCGGEARVRVSSLRRDATSAGAA